ncbi:transposase [Jannaschia seohaensis]|uniref:transposase n=1 Tax=Jannaschia seohaensis TaxID=475081 RepID=UPI000D6ABD8C
MRGEVLDGVERRLRWSDEKKLRILMEVGLRSATLTDVARRHSVSRSQLDKWRREN